MSIQQSAQDPFAAGSSAPVTTSLMRRHRVAQSKLSKAVESQQPVTLMMGADSFELSLLIGLFVSGLDERTTVVRLCRPQADALAAYGEISRAIGFDPKDLTLSDLQNVLTLFLEHQCKHGHRTIVFIEKADEQSMWLLDAITRLIKSTEASPIGRTLMVILSGSNRLTEVLQNSAFTVLRKKAGVPIKLAAFSIFETREFLRQMCSNAGYGDIQSMFDFDAIERLHNLSGGSPHVLTKLFRECVAIVNNNGIRSASSKVAVKAARNLTTENNRNAERPAAKPALVEKASPPRRRLLIRCPNLPPRELPLRPGRFMVGRSCATDICLPDASVSRRHVLLIDSGEEMQVLDLGSTNGTFAGSERVSETTLASGTVLKLGKCEIEYSVN
jgi:type II secretory pathway predicted ATPase ExeA